MFVSSYLAFHAGDTGLMIRALQVALAEAGFCDPFVSASGWLPSHRVMPMVERLTLREHSVYRRVAMSVYGIVVVSMPRA